RRPLSHFLAGWKSRRDVDFVPDSRGHSQDHVVEGLRLKTSHRVQPGHFNERVADLDFFDGAVRAEEEASAELDHHSREICISISTPEVFAMGPVTFEMNILRSKAAAADYREKPQV